MKTLRSQIQVVCEQMGIAWSSLYFTIGDLHGRSDISIRVIEILEELNAANVVFLGDYIDRKADPLGVVRAVHQAKLRNTSWQLLQGNHERCAMDAFEGGIALNEENSIFNICSPDEIEECCKIFNALPIYYETDHLVFVHGGIDSSYNMKIQDIPVQELLWSYGVHPEYREKTVVRGHEIFKQPTEFENNIATQTFSWCDNSPFCISIVVNSSRDRKLLGWIEIDLSGTDEVNLVVCNSISEQ